MLRTDLYSNNLKYIKASIISPRQIAFFSNGRVRSSKTLDYSTFEPITGGLFCEDVFGSSKRDSCVCGNRINVNNNIIRCNVCKIDVTSFKIRRYKIGHIKLKNYFMNTMFYKSIPSYLSLFLGISLIDIENILYNDFYLVLYPCEFLYYKEVLSWEEYSLYYNTYKDMFFALTGFEAIEYILNNFNLIDELNDIEDNLIKIKDYSSSSYKRNIKRYKLIKFFIDNNINPNIFIINIVPVLPPDLRPLVKLSDDKIASSDLNELYKRVLDRSNRLKRLKNNNYFSDIVLINEKNLIQDSINKLFDNKEKPNEFAEVSKKILKSICNNIKGKTGIFRQNLLGKRVDFSGRAVIVSGPFLKIDQCSIPKYMAFELFRPFIYNKLLTLNYVDNIKYAKLEVDNKTDLALKMLKIILTNNLVLLNRAPTLHRLGIQAFNILLNNDKVIKLHPLVCSAFNADFDGDQMAVHIPVSSKSRNEFKILLLSSNNILTPSSGDVSITPTQDIILGIYYATKLIKNIEKLYYFNNLYDIQCAYDANLIKLNSRIFYRFKNLFNKKFNYEIYETTFGRALIYNILPKGLSYEIINKTLRKKDINLIFSDIYYNFGSDVIVKFSDDLMKLGFSFVTKSGISISLDDMLVYKDKYLLIEKSRSLVKTYDIDYLNGLLSFINRKKKIIDIWELTSDIIYNYTMEKFLKLPDNHSNSLYSIIDSGARGSDLQIRQICCMRGLMVYKNLGLMEIPIFSNLKEGLDVLEYFYFSHSSRKALADTALKTSSAGYLTRKLVEVANNITTIKYDCKTKSGLIYKNLIYKGNVIENFYDRIFGKVLLNDIYDLNNNLIFIKNTLILKEHIIKIKSLEINMLVLRSVITCKCLTGVCCLCYGLDLGRGGLVTPGIPVGIIAAQSIGEPGTQLTMRTFHSGGALTKKEVISSYFANNSGYISYSNSLNYIINKDNEKIVISSIGKIYIKDKFNNNLEYFIIPYSSILLVSDNDFIKKGDIICKWDGSNKIFLSDRNGYIKFGNLFENLNYVKRFDNITGNYIYEIIKSFNSNSNLYFKICDDYNKCESIRSYSKFDLTAGGFLYFFDNDYINKGDIFYKFFIGSNSAALDITGGLPKVTNLFEARIPKNSSLISPINGRLTLSYKEDYKYLSIKDKISKKKFKKRISNNKIISVNNGTFVNKGDLLIDGDLNPHDILDIHGVEFLVECLLSEIKNIYYSQGVKINDKHIEIIIKQMLSKVIITDKGNSKFFLGDIVDKKKVIELNKIHKENCKNLIKYKIILTGITKSSLNTDSFLGSASFQQTNTILSRAAIFREIDNLETLKNNVMLGRIIPVGTGYYHKIFKRSLIIN